MLSGRDDYSDNLLVWLILPDETLQYLANFYSAELPTDCMVIIQHQFNFGPGFSLLNFCLDSLTCGENISMLRFLLEAFLYMFTGAFMFVTSSRALFSATLSVIKMHDFKSSGFFFLNKNKTYQLVCKTLITGFIVLEKPTLNPAIQNYSITHLCLARSNLVLAAYFLPRWEPTAPAYHCVLDSSEGQTHQSAGAFWHSVKL